VGKGSGNSKSSKLGWEEGEYAHWYARKTIHAQLCPLLCVICTMTPGAVVLSTARTNCQDVFTCLQEYRCCEQEQAWRATQRQHLIPIFPFNDYIWSGEDRNDTLSSLAPTDQGTSRAVRMLTPCLLNLLVRILHSFFVVLFSLATTQVLWE